MSALCHGLVVDSTFERTSPLHSTVSLSSYSCSEGCGLHHNSKVRNLALLLSAHAHCTNWHSIVRSMLLVVFSHVIKYQTYLW